MKGLRSLLQWVKPEPEVNVDQVALFRDGVHDAQSDDIFLSAGGPREGKLKRMPGDPRLRGERLRDQMERHQLVVSHRGRLGLA